MSAPFKKPPKAKCPACGRIVGLVRVFQGTGSPRNHMPLDDTPEHLTITLPSPTATDPTRRRRWCRGGGRVKIEEGGR